MSAKSFISARKILTLTTDLILDPAASRTADKFARHCFCCQCTATRGEEKIAGRDQGGEGGEFRGKLREVRCGL
jgi:hypothetical protein